LVRSRVDNTAGAATLLLIATVAPAALACRPERATASRRPTRPSAIPLVTGVAGRCRSRPRIPPLTNPARAPEHGAHPQPDLPLSGALSIHPDDQDERGRVVKVKHEIPDVVVRRLPLYIRTLSDLLADGITTVSSTSLGETIGVTAAQIRRDLSYFGKFGKQGKGYDVRSLIAQIKSILSLDQTWPVAVVGIGKLGEAVAQYHGFETNNFPIVALFDHSPQRIGQRVGDLTIQSIEDLPAEVRRLDIRVAIVAVPAATAQEVTDLLVAAGIKAILNYAPAILQVPPSVKVRNIDPIAALQSMSYYLDED
jgi:redox-sensing transcriptional repressor